MVATEDLKLKLHRLIDEENDPAVLAMLESVLSKKEAEAEIDKDAWTDEDRAALEEGLADIRAGRMTAWEGIKQNLEEQEFRKELTKLNAESNSFAFLAGEEELYSLDDLKERYR